MHNRDMTTGKPLGLIARFALPMLIGSIFQQMYSMVDSIIVGKFVGVDAFAAVGATASVLYMMIAVIIGFNVGVSVTISQFVGAGRDDRVRDTMGVAMLISMGLTIFLSVGGNIAAGGILRLLKTPDDIYPGALTYLRINFASCIGPLFYNAFAHMIRALGDSRTPLVALIISSLLNIVLDLVFVLALGMGVGGVALATAAAQLISALFCIVVLKRKLNKYWCGRENLHLRRDIVGRICRVGIPMAVQSLFTSFGGMFVQRLVNGFGAVVVAGYTAAVKLNDLALQGIMSMGDALGVYAGQNTGAEKPERVREGVRAGLKLGFCLSAVFTIIMLCAGQYLVRLFVSSTETEVIEVAMAFMRCVSPFYFIGCIMYIFTNTLRGMGHVTVPTAASFVELGMKTLAAYAFAALAGVNAIWFAWPAGYFSAVILLGVYYYIKVMRKRLA